MVDFSGARTSASSCSLYDAASNPPHQRHRLLDHCLGKGTKTQRIMTERTVRELTARLAAL